ncbi:MULTISPECIES: FUSC family protein [unclassified Streptomyces]|uniref:FUSC family protein n=1 Tax=unclassified Streptomyces TaxID=2593676 RepID=UPI003D94A668
MVNHRSYFGRRIRDGVVASDPGLTRLRAAVSSAAAIAGSIALEYGFVRVAGITGTDRVATMLIGSFVGMLAAVALTATAVRARVVTAAFFPVSAWAGLAVGTFATRDTSVMLVVFVAMMSAAVYVRRFGGAFFHYGAMGWLGYFFAVLLRPSPGTLPRLLVAAALSTFWVLALTLTLLRGTPRWALRTAELSFAARTRTMAGSCTRILSTRTPKERARIRSRLHTQQLHLAEIALLIEAWSAEPETLPPDRAPAALRRQLLGLQAAVETMSDAADTLSQATVTEQSRQTAVQLARALSSGEHTAAAKFADALLVSSAADPAAGSPDVDAGVTAARTLAMSAREYIARVEAGALPAAPDDRATPFRPVIPIAMGNLPGSPAFAHAVPARGGAWNPLRNARASTRQAIQVAVAGAIAVVLGRALAEPRYYWATISVFIAFTGTATRSESATKVTHRVAGTLTGTVVGFFLGRLTTGHITTELAVVVLCMATGFYLAPLNHTYLIFFVTLMVCQLYSALHLFSWTFLVTRLEETVLGALIAALVALLVLPTSSRDAVGHVRESFLTSVGNLLRTVAGHMDGSDTGNELETATRTVDLRLRALALLATPRTHGAIRSDYARHLRHQLTLSALAARLSRALAQPNRHMPDHADAVDLAAAARSLADATDGLAKRSAEGTWFAETHHHLVAARKALPESRDDHPATPLLLRLHGLLDGMASHPVGRPHDVGPGRHQRSAKRPGTPAHARRGAAS